MCGICGIVSLDKPIKASFLQRMLEHLRHRGPDDWGAYIYDQGKCLEEQLLNQKEGTLMLGNRRLSIIDLSKAGNQPMSNEDGTIWITYNGEIYNYRDLRKVLIKNGHTFKSETDTEVIVHGYEAWGIEGLLKRLQGMYAFAILDSQVNITEKHSSPKLLIARDRMGIKPLYYYYDGKLLLFASELRAMLASQLVKKELNPDAVIGYLTYQSVLAPVTIVKRVKTLLPGHYIIFQNGQLEIKEYWDISNNTGTFKISKSYEINELRELLTDSVKARTISDVPLGAFLSGGIDSSVVGGLMSQILDQPVITLSVAFNESEFNEADYARVVAQRFKTIHHEFLVTGEDAKREMSKIIKAMDEPTGNGVNTYFISKMAREAGLKVALSGLGGDELFCGYPSFYRTTEIYRLLRVWHLIPKTVRKTLVNSLKKLQYNSSTTYDRFVELLGSNLSFVDAYSISRKIFPNWAQQGLLSEEFKHRFNPESSPQKEYYGYLARKELDQIGQISYLECRTYMHNTLLRDTDFMSMAHSLEVRVPLIDHQLVEYMFGIPSELKMDKGVSKKLLVEAVDNLLPQEILQREKQGFIFPLKMWMKNELKPLIEDALSQKTVQKRGLFNEVKVHKMWNSFLNDPKGDSWAQVWLLAVLELWCREHLDR